MRIYCPDPESLDLNSKYVNPVLKYLHTIGMAEKGWQMTELGEADFVTLANVYPFYYFKKKIAQIADWAKAAKKLDKTLIVWHKGDLDPPAIENVVYLQTAVRRGHKDKFRIPVPFFINDPIIQHFSGELRLHGYTEKPEIGFCGNAKSTLFKTAVSTALNIREKIRYTLDSTRYNPDTILPPTLLRNKVLRVLQADKRVAADFIIRDNFNAGKKHLNEGVNAKIDSTVNDFFQNMKENQYIVCARGYGNFSVRFYETLACGRIPLFIDSEGRLPFDNIIDYKKHCAWAPASDINHAGNYLLQFHKELNEDKIKTLELANRELWQGYLSFEGFFNHFGELLEGYI